jgi:hypothetical protein
MPVSGAKAKPPGEKVHRVPPVHEWIEVERIPYDGPVPLLGPRYRVDPESGLKVRTEWPPRTREWWRVISAMPHCVLWDETDWQYAIDVAEVHARFIEGASGTELRIREKVLGNTMDARRDLRIRYIDPKPEAAPPAEVPDNVHYLNL